MRFITTILIAGVASSQLGATDCGNVIADPGFDMWCGNMLCSWQLERGSIEPVPTWNEGDLGVELVGNNVAIYELSPVDSSDGTCIEFDVIANIDPDAEVDLNIDVLGDGTIDSTQRLPSTYWKPLTYQISVKAPYAGIVFELAKTGDGRAIVANIGAKIVSDGCAGLVAIDPQQRPTGAPCAVDSDCTSFLCGIGEIAPPFAVGGGQQPTVCVDCDADHGCVTGEVCGVGDPDSAVRAAPTTCVLQASRLLGEQCGVDSECMSSYCTNNMCSTCNQTAGCAPDETCAPANAITPVEPWECNPMHHAHATGAPCVNNEDCASDMCFGGGLFQCADGRSCSWDPGGDLVCPFSVDAPNPLQNGACSNAGFQSGICG